MKEKKILTRKQKALRRVGLALALLLVVNWWYGGFYILPFQALRESYEYYGIVEPKVIQRKWMPELAYAELAYLTEGKEAVHFTFLSYISVLGWQDMGAEVLDCDDGYMVHLGWTDEPKEDGTEYFVLFGRVDERNISHIRLDIEESTIFLEEGEEPFTASYLVEEFIEAEDGRYFLSLFDWTDDTWATTCNIIMTAYDSAGNTVEKQDLTRIP